MSSHNVRMDLFKDAWMNDPWEMARLAELPSGLSHLEEKLKIVSTKFGKTYPGMSLDEDREITFDFA